KKPIRLAFLDFSTPEKRAFCTGCPVWLPNIPRSLFGNLKYPGGLLLNLLKAAGTPYIQI
ncbi:MAG TPA: hypothetical protein PLP20_05755, partial [Oscillospiraceae bacterium]|nr:hypothetical protein [Oscillospiraceae bacterium]